MSDLLGNLARAFPFLTFLAVVAVLIVLFRSWSRVSSGSTGAGSLRTLTPRVPGLQSVPWQVVSVEDSFGASPANILALLLQRAEDLDVAVSLPPGLPAGVQVDVVLQQLEEHLDLPPLKMASAPPRSPLNPPPSPTKPPR